MMAKRIGTRLTGRETAERTRGGKEQSPRKTRPRSPTPRPKRDVRSTAERAGVTSATSESGVEPAGQSGSRDGAPLRGAAAGGQPSASDSASPSQPGWCPNPGGVRLSLGALTIDAERAEVERGALKAVVSVRRGDELLYSDRVNLDWSGGRDKFLRKATRALATAGVATSASARVHHTTSPPAPGRPHSGGRTRRRCRWSVPRSACGPRPDACDRTSTPESATDSRTPCPPVL